MTGLIEGGEGKGNAQKNKKNKKKVEQVMFVCTTLTFPIRQLYQNIDNLALDRWGKTGCEYSNI